MHDRIKRHWQALREHPAFRAGTVYSGSAFVLLQVMDLLGFATSTVRWSGVALAAGLLALVAGLVVAHHHLAPLLSVARIPRGRRLVAALAALLLAGTGAWWAGGRLVAAPVAAGAEAIAVLPFTASGPGVDALGEGMVDLLSTSLDQVGGVRAIHPRTVLHRWARHAGDGTLDLEGALAVGREVGAGSVLLGSLVGAGDRIRLTAELFTLDGRRIGEARTEGEADAVLTLVDDLAVRMLREVWRSRQPVPSLRLEAITTSSVEALQDYLRGERFYRAAQWDSALVAFADAVARDSTFALAHLRLAEGYGWTHHHTHPDAIASAATAVRFAHRLPARERRLASAFLLHSAGDMAGVDSADSFVRAYPDDAMGWYMLGDVRFHTQEMLALTTDDIVAPIDSVYRLDPGLSAPLVHVMELALLSGDSTLYFRSLDRFERAGGDPDRWHREGALRWGPADSLPARFAAAFPDVRLEIGPSHSWHLWSTFPLRRPDMDPDVTDLIVDGIRPDLRPGVTPEQLARLRVTVHLARGRIDAARDEARRAVEAGLGRWSVFNPMLDAVLLGLAEEADLQPLVPTGPGSPPYDWFARYIGLATGDTARLDTLAFQPGMEIPDDAPDFVPGVVEALAGWEAIVRGQIDAGLVRIRNGLADVGYSGSALSFVVPILFHVGRDLAHHPDTRDDGIRHLEAIRLRQSPLLRAPIDLLLAEAYEARGDHAAAAFHYAEVVRLWSDADAHLQPSVTSARRALARLSPGDAPRD